MNARRTTAKPPALVWSEEGRICCVGHAPNPGSDTWRSGRWRRMRDHEITAFAAEIGRAVECETCRGVRLRGAEVQR